ncbi:MAG TPA: hypothetical protein VFH47_02740, partial [Candidatus Thermoplasmatota archaeon]|nr:hypothetical protein [Candidatus Thermoplasmatota archaeon]
MPRWPAAASLLALLAAPALAGTPSAPLADWDAAMLREGGVLSAFVDGRQRGFDLPSRTELPAPPGQTACDAHA